jgi:hypothetical protein
VNCLEMPSKKTSAICTIAILFLIFAQGSFMVSAQTSSFGYTEVGSSSNSTFEKGLYVSNFTGPGNLGNITQVQIYLTTGGTVAQAVIYLDDNGKPGALLNASAPVTVEGTSGRWVSFDVSYDGIPNFTYWIGMLIQSAATYYSTSGVNGTTIYYGPASEAATLFPLGSMATNESLSVYAIYTPSMSQGQNGQWLQTLLLGVTVAGVVLAVIVAFVFVRRKQKTLAITKS